MSTLAQINTLCAALRKLWTDTEGSMALLYDFRGGELYRICCGTASNRHLIAERCKVWKGQDKVYDGELEGLPLFRALDTGRVCRAVVTTARALRRGDRGSPMCCGRKGARCGRCRLNAEQTAV